MQLVQEGNNRQALASYKKSFELNHNNKEAKKIIDELS